jgi:hypothetical protein
MVDLNRKIIHILQIIFTFINDHSEYSSTDPDIIWSTASNGPTTISGIAIVN